MKEKILRMNLYFGLFVLFVSSILLNRQVAFMKNWYFCFAWWSFILIMDSLNFRKNKVSPLSQSIKNFLFTAFISVFVWLVFELFNLRIKNWTYHNLPQNLFERWTGYFVAYASVIPALQEIYLFVEGILAKKRLALFKIRVTPTLLYSSFLIGVVSVFLTLNLPRIFFPFVWLCFIFLLEPLNYWLGNDTFLKDVEKKNWTRLWSWLASGLVAGFLWEFWNFWANSRWEYSIPYLDVWRLFEMPVFGYGGFLPFALEVFALYSLLSFAYKKLQRKIFLKGLVFVLLLLFYITCFNLIDNFTLIR
jgi:hypothetical protein